MAKLSEEQKLKIIAQYVHDSKGRAKIAASMTMPLRNKRDYKSVVRKAFYVHQLLPGALPLYDRDVDVTAYIVGEEGDGIVSVAKAKRILFPIYEISANPEAPISDIKQRRYDVVLRMQDRGKSEIQRKEDDRGLAAMNAAIAAAANPNAPIGTAAPVAPAIFSDGIARVERWNLRVARMFMNATEFADIRKFGRDVLDFETMQTLLRTGLQGVVYGAQVITSERVQAGRIYICTEKEFFGRMPVRTELTVISADRPWDRVIGFAMFENLGQGVHNNYGLQAIDVAR